MTTLSPLTFKIADRESEFEQIHRLNYRTFVEEIPQHEANPGGRLKDRFDAENTYVICLAGERVVGMVCVRGRRPFSLDEKLDRLDSYLPAGCKVCEIRLLSVEQNYRNGRVFAGLIKLLTEHCKGAGHDLAIISGTVRQLKLYRHLGFVPFGPEVGAPAARFQPMYLTWEAFDGRRRKLFPAAASTRAFKTLVNLLPGPVTVAPEVRRSFSGAPASHRSETFIADFRATKRLLCALVGARSVEILMGSGTLANDAVAAQFSLLPGNGLVLSNGEFGDRLIDQATRFGLPFEALCVEWGGVFDRVEIGRRLDRDPNIKWLWAVHCETSTGILNDLGMLKNIAAERGLRLAMDCISSIGTTAVDLRGVYLASGVSGKGLAALPGLSMVFYNHTVTAAARAIPRYLDLGFYAERGGIPFTISSNLVYALKAALSRRRPEGSLEAVSRLSRLLRSRLRAMGFCVLGRDADVSPAVITIALPAAVHSETLGRRLEAAGYSLSYMSEYLLRRNWIQICLMGECAEAEVLPLLERLREFSYALRRAS